ncbi:hypothetical protein ACFYO7_20685 [Nocardia salmonicida]|uniref:hypothetical protein n=1 Tax=Nocardia salmonicida TaxID=53431 RepID=UPI0036D039EA
MTKADVVAGIPGAIGGVADGLAATTPDGLLNAQGLPIEYFPATSVLGESALAT